jgi:drug/metabolite transporter (DMT)-like permease
MPSALRGRKLAVYCFLCAVWGSTWLVIKIGLDYLPPLRFAGIRMGAACLLLAPFAFRRGLARPVGGLIRDQGDAVVVLAAPGDIAIAGDPHK